MTDTRPGPLRQFGAAVVHTVQAALFLALVLGPALAGFLAPVGPPVYHVSVAGVTDAGDTTGADLSAESMAVFEDLVADEDNAITRRTTDPPELLARESTTVVRDGYAFRVTAERSPPPLRGPAILLGAVASALSAIVGAIVVSRDLV